MEEKPKRQRKPRRNHAAELAAIELYVAIALDTVRGLVGAEGNEDDGMLGRVAALEAVKAQIEKNRGVKG